MVARPPTSTTRADARAVAGSLARVRLRVAAGARPGDLRGLDADDRRAIRVADRVGAPLLPVIEAAEVAATQRREIDDAVASAVAPARTVGAALVLLPVLVVPGLATMLDLDLSAFYTSPIGMVVGAVALGLWLAGIGLVVGMVRMTSSDLRPPSPVGRVVVVGVAVGLVVGPWAAVAAAVVARLTWRAPAPPPHPDLAAACELVAAALQAGLSVGAALREVAADLPDLTADLRRLALLVELGHVDLGAAAPPALVGVATVVADARNSGGPLGPALRSLAAHVRADVGAARHQQAMRLPARLTFPTALCLLPATVLAIGAPIVASGLSVVSGP